MKTFKEIRKLDEISTKLAKRAYNKARKVNKKHDDYALGSRYGLVGPKKQPTEPKQKSHNDLESDLHTKLKKRGVKPKKPSWDRPEFH